MMTGEIKKKEINAQAMQSHPENPLLQWMQFAAQWGGFEAAGEILPKHTGQRFWPALADVLSYISR